MAAGHTIPCFWLEYSDPLVHDVYDDDRELIAEAVDLDEWKAEHEYRMAKPILVSHDGQRGTVEDFGPGAMLDFASHPGHGDAYGYMVGPDGRCLIVVLPPAGPALSHWYVDGKAKDGGRWSRTGDPTADPPTLSVTPSILTPDYHGFLTDGVLREV